MSTSTTEYIEKSALALMGITVLAILITLVFAPTPQAETGVQVEARHDSNKKEGFVSEVAPPTKPGFSVQAFQRGVQEGFGLQEGMSDPIGDKIKDAFERPFNDMKDAITKPFNDIKEFMDKIGRFFESIPRRINDFIGAFREVGDGINLEFVNLGKSLDLGLLDVFNVVGRAATCGIDMIKNFRNCILYYLLDWIGKMMYGVFVEFPVFIIKMVSGGKVDLKPIVVDKIVNIFKKLDKMLHKSTGVHFMHFPDSVLNMCYYCSFDKEVAQLTHDWTDTIPNLLNEPAQKFTNAKHKFESVFQ
jgi:hypothetical protein